MAAAVTTGAAMAANQALGAGTIAAPVDTATHTERRNAVVEASGDAPSAGPVPVAAYSAVPTSDVISTRPERDLDASLTALAQSAEQAAVARFELGVPYEAGNDDTLDGWIARALGLMGLPQSLAPGIKEIIMHESGGDPNAINTWDSNAAAGRASQGLMQTIPATFEACVLPSLADRSITDPVANITAGVRSMIANHGIEVVMQGGRRNSADEYIGYGGGAPCSFDIADLDIDLGKLLTAH